jgi:hypothetical protein
LLEGLAQRNVDLDVLDASAEDEAESWRLWKLKEPLYFHTYDADLAERVMGKTLISVEAAEAGDAIVEDWNLTPRLGEITPEDPGECASAALL